MIKTICGEEALKKIVSLLADVMGLYGDYAEVGVYQGGSARLISDHMDSNSTLFLFDTFEGIPETSEKDNFHKKGDFSDTSEWAVQKMLEDTGKNIIIRKGIFPETAYFITEKFRFVHLDVDIYQSYKDGLEFFYPRMVPGGVMVFDDYNALASCAGAKIAVDEFLLDKPEKPIQGGGGSQYYMVKL